jgi:hypothetical protein
MSQAAVSSALPERIDQVIDRLDRIIERAIETRSRLGYFAALYNRVTIAVRDGIRAGAFADNARMEALDVAFANRYIEAYDQHQRGENPSGAWCVAFRAADDEHLSVLQHLFLGMNAHIHLDLGVACVHVSPHGGIEALEHDFNRINDLLASLVPTVEEQVGEIRHRFSFLTHVAHGLDQRVVNFSMAHARLDAWRFARHLAALADPAERVARVIARDTETVAIARHFTHGGALRTLLGGDDGRVAEHIRVLARGEYGLADV